MKLLQSLLLCVLGAFVVDASAAKRNSDGTSRSPNFIIIYADDLGYADTSVQMMDADPSTKHDFIQTPGLDRLAKIGARFSAAYAPTPTCTGSRISIQFGKTSARMQYRNVFDVLSSYQRPDGYDDETTLGEMLKESGRNYATAMFGKGASALGRFEDAGYDETDELPGEPGGNGNGHGSYWDPKKKTPFPPDNPKRLHSLRRDSVAFVNKVAGKQPFFMMVNHYAPHIPHLATKEAFERCKKRWISQGRDTDKIDQEKSPVYRDIIYAAMIEEMDMNVGALIDALKAKGELDNTYLIFTSDNGGGHSRKEKIDGVMQRFNGPLQEGKRSIFEGGIRVPTVISGPGIKPGSQCDVPIVQWDFLPTFHDLSGSKAPLPKGVDGGSLRDVFVKGNKGKVKRGAPGIIHHYTCHYHPPISSIIIGDYKFMRHLNSGEIRLFNLKDDYREEHDLHTAMPDKVHMMDTTLRKYVEEVDGGTAEQVREALYKTMDKFGRQAKEGFVKKIAALKEEKPSDLEAQKAKLLKDLNQKLKKNAFNKEKTRLQAEFRSWRESAPQKNAEELVEAKWVDLTEEQILQQKP
jgi:arylsulfatase A